ncbi:MAG: MFS transporter, partial [Acidobacteriia bacterium]|nr:MFS transporter [Terriglobia bacterium]
RERRFSLNAVAFVGALPYFLMAISSISGGLLADRWVSRGASPVKVRRGFLVTGLLLTSVLLPSALLPRIEFAVAGLFAACFTLGIYASNLYALTQALAGPEASGRWTGLQNACGNLAGIVGPILTGWLITKTKGYAVPFLAASVSCILGASSFWFLVKEPGKKAQQAEQPAG